MQNIFNIMQKTGQPCLLHYILDALQKHVIFHSSSGEFQHMSVNMAKQLPPGTLITRRGRGEMERKVLVGGRSSVNRPKQGTGMLWPRSTSSTRPLLWKHQIEELCVFPNGRPFLFFQNVFLCFENIGLWKPKKKCKGHRKQGHRGLKTWPPAPLEEMPRGLCYLIWWFN